MTAVRYTNERLDHLGIVAGVCRDIGIAPYLDALDEQYHDHVSVGSAVVAMILNGLGFSNRRMYVTPQFFANKPLEVLLGPGIRAEDLNDDCLGRALDWVAGHDPTALFAGIALQARLARIEQEKKDEVRKLSKKGRYLLLESTYTEQLAHQALGLYTSLGVTKTELPAITCVADLLEACCDDLQAIADSKGAVSQLLFDKSCKLYKVKPAQRHIA